MLATIFIMLRWIAQVRAVSDRITLNFTDGNIVEYDVSRKVISASEFLSGFRRFYGDINTVTKNSTVTMECSSQMFNMIDKLINEENIENYEEIVREFNINIICEFLGILDYLQYDYEVSGIIHKRLVEHIFPRIVFSVTNEEQRSAYIESSNEYIKEEIKNQIRLILPLYLQRYKLGLQKEENMAVIYKDVENKNQKEVLELIEFSELRVHPGALDSDIEEEMNIDKNQRLGVLLWMFDVYYFEISTLDLSGHILTNGLMGQLSAMRRLKTLNLRECSVKLGNNYDWIETGFKALENLDISGVKIDENIACALSKIENLRKLKLRECSVKLGNDYDWMRTGFKALEDLDISGMKLEEAFAGILCRITSLKKLNMEKCFIKPESSLEFIRKQKDLKELRISRNYLSEEYLNIIFSHENIKILDMDCCVVDDMYIYGGKIESTEMLKVLNGRKIYIEEREMIITISKTDDEYRLKNWKTYNSRLMFFSDDGEMKVNLSIDDTGSDALKGRTKTWRLSELNGSQVFVKDNKEIRIVIPQTSSIMEGLKEFTRGDVYFTGKDNGKMNFLDVMKSKGFMKNVVEYNCGQVYFGDKQIEMILSHKGLMKLNMRQCGLESKAIMKIKDKSTLMELDLSNNNIIGENDMIHIIKECPNLRKLNMSKCRMLVTGDFEGILVLENLEELNIGGNKLNPKYIKYIFKHKKLLRLNLEGCGLIEDNLKGIEDLEGLKELFTGDNLISRRDLDRIFKLEELEVLNMSKSGQFNIRYNRKVNINGIKGLCKLKVLDLRNNRLYEENINEIFELKELRDLRMEDYWIRCGMLRNISNLINLEKLSMRKFEIDENDMEGITNLKNLKELNMFVCNLSGEKAFDNIGKLNNKLAVLKFEKGAIFNSVIIKKLAELTNLRELQFVNNNTSFAILCDVLEKLTCLRVLDIGTIDASELIEDKKFPSGSLSRLEILKLRYTHVSNEFFKGPSNLVNLKELINLREFSLTCSKGNNIKKSSILDISVFPSGLRKLKVSGKHSCPFDLQCISRKEAVEIFENLEELELCNIENISEGIVGEINNCTKLRKLMLRMNDSSSPKYDLKGISDIVTLEELVLEEVDLRSEDIVQLSCLKQLRRLEILHCDLNNKYLNEIGKLKSLEVLNIEGNFITHSMNEILKLKNLREFVANDIRFDYDKEGDFELVKGFEKLECNKWEIYKDDNRIEHGNANFKDVLEKMGKEATMNNWKGVTKLRSIYIKIDSVIFLAISSKLVSIESIRLYLANKLRIGEGETEILNRCQMIREITLVDNTDRAFLPLSIVINIIRDNLFLQKVEMSVDELNIDLANLLSECAYLHSIDLHVKKYTDGFFETLLKKPKESMLKFVDIYYFNHKRVNRKEEPISFSYNNLDRRERIIKYMTEEDVDAIIRAGEENVCTDVYFYTV
ncbi:hypothetical protein PAEPH01_0653 [Pancytospora epiphaga]|nr:hypothetical protein PAEPH01_0653 [Pancytospora epiphaga]